MIVAIAGPAEGRELLQSFLIRYVKSVCAQIEIVSADNLEALPLESQWNLAFIYTYDADIEAFQSFQSANPSCDIVLWADNEKWAMHGIRLHTAGFFVMPVTEEVFSQTMQQCKASWLTGMKTLKGTAEGEQIRIHCADILFAEADGHHTTIYTKSQKISVNLSLSMLESQLGDGFVRCHRSFVVNIRSIQAISPEGVLLLNGELIPVGIGKTAAEAEEKIRAFRSEIGDFI